MSQASVQERAVQEEIELLARLRAGDERAFETLVARCYPTMLAVAQHHVRTRAVAEEVVQEAWLGVLKGLDRFEGRSSLKTWILRILVNTAKTRGVRESRSVPYSSLVPEGDEPAVAPERFRREQDSYPGHWRSFTGDWQRLPEEVLTGAETLEVVIEAIEQLPTAQRTVIALRDIQGCEPEGCARCWTSRRATSASCCTAPARRCGPRWRGTSMAEQMTCQEVVALVTDYLDRALAPGEASRFEQHLTFCDGCDWHLDQMRTTIATVGRVSDVDLPPQTRERLLAAFREFKRP